MKVLSCLLVVMLATSGFGQRIMPEDMEYMGAFRLPDSPGMPDNVGWGWSNWSSGLTYFPGGDPEGSEDGYPGSLFGVGHDHTQFVSEVSIPVPVISAAKGRDRGNWRDRIRLLSTITISTFMNMNQVSRSGTCTEDISDIRSKRLQ